jgi:molybdenum cofactor cytidylyltransferase
VICAVLLAAGSARRFGGGHKLLAPMPHRGTSTPVIRVAAERLLDSERISELIVVLGRDPERVRGALAGIGGRVHLVHNAEYERGMSTSLCAGVRAAQRHGEAVDAALVALGDQPEVRREVVDALATVFEQLPETARRNAIVLPRYHDVRGHPILFGAHVFPELLDVTGDRGGRTVVERERGRVHHVDFDFGAPADVDTVDDLRALLERVTAGRDEP